ncbi:MAG TPA: 4'-phosphopantetheinyl transferase superfamily protein [Verrucomicrobiae bacterium]|jgi:4'-phosphopantetheinyl transferase|nr:4'-phosphopantetheinyl transferase superfamily protein [Verrucomicrobiae bacterium]
MTLPLELIRDGQPVDASFAAAFEQELPAISSSIDSFLGPAERAYLETLQFPLRRNHYLLGRYAAKQALRACLKTPDILEVEVLKGVFEQPVVLTPLKVTAEISIAHSKGVGVAVACRAGHPIGIDVEWLDNGKAEFLASCLSAQEEKLVAQSAQSAPATRYLIWTIKEALSKALRCGLMTPFEILEISTLLGLSPKSWTAQFRNFAQYKAHSWLIDRYFLSLVIPKNTEVVFSPAALLPHLAAASGTLDQVRPSDSEPE